MLLAETEVWVFWNDTQQSLAAVASLGLCPHVSRCRPWVGLCRSHCLINSGTFCSWAVALFFVTALYYHPSPLQAFLHNRLFMILAAELHFSLPSPHSA